MKKIIISGEDYRNQFYHTPEWEASAVITYWEHDFVKDIYIIAYEEK